MKLLHEHTTLTLARERKQMDEHVERMKGALKDSLSEHYRTLKEMLKLEEGAFLTPKIAAWTFGLFMLLEAVASIALVMWLK